MGAPEGAKWVGWTQFCGEEARVWGGLHISGYWAVGVKIRMSECRRSVEERILQK